VQTTFRDGLSFDLFSFCQDRLHTPEVDVGLDPDLQALIVSLMIVVIDEHLDLLSRITRQKAFLEQHTVL
jgi:hypothetical protein